MVLSAEYLLPIDRPLIRGGWIEIADGRIVRLGEGRAPSDARDLGSVAVLPGLVNAHTHLELSWLAGRVRPAASMVDWLRRLIAMRAAGPPGGNAGLAQAAHGAAVAMRETGTVLVGDISNSLTTPPILRDVGLGGVVFHELLGFSVGSPALVVQEAWRQVDALATDANADLRMSVVAHAPYSVSAALIAEIARECREAPLSVHLAESAEEIEFLRTGGGPFPTLLRDLGVWDERWRVPECDPVAYLRRLGYLRPGLLAVHAVHLSDDALEGLRDAGAVVVTCPRSNEWVGGGIPRVAHFYAVGVPVAVGTDSLASAASLNLFDELAQLRRIAPDVAAACLLDSATRVGAEALGFGGDFGTIAAGKRAALVSVEIPPGTSDVEEYLVSGVPSTSVRPIRF